MLYKVIYPTKIYLKNLYYFVVYNSKSKKMCSKMFNNALVVEGWGINELNMLNINGRNNRKWNGNEIYMLNSQLEIFLIVLVQILQSCQRLLLNDFYWNIHTEFYLDVVSRYI